MEWLNSRCNCFWIVFELFCIHFLGPAYPTIIFFDWFFSLKLFLNSLFLWNRILPLDMELVHGDLHLCFVLLPWWKRPCDSNIITRLQNLHFHKVNLTWQNWLQCTHWTSTHVADVLIMSKKSSNICPISSW